MKDVAGWRREVRAELIARRMAMPPERREMWSAAIGQHLRTLLDSLPHGILGFYWPFKGEFDPRSLVPELKYQGWHLALPVVAAKDQPLIYRNWSPATRMERGVLGIMVPEDKEPVVMPTVVLSPLVGFDDAKYRLGNGGGYFDRTLAAMNPKPYAIGVGFAFARLATIYPQPYDRPMDAIVTEDGLIGQA